MICDIFVTWVNSIYFICFLKIFFTHDVNAPVKVYHCSNDWKDGGYKDEPRGHPACQSTHHFYITDTMKFDGYDDTLMWHVNKPEQFATLLKTQEETVADILWYADDPVTESSCNCYCFMNPDIVESIYCSCCSWFIFDQMYFSFTRDEINNDKRIKIRFQFAVCK